MGAEFSPQALQAALDAADSCGGQGKATAAGYEVRPDAGRDFPAAVRDWLAGCGFTRAQDRHGPCYRRAWPMETGGE